MEILGKVTHRLDPKSGTSAKGKAWCSQDYVVEYDFDQQYPHSVVLNFFGEEMVKEAQQLLHKDTIANFSFDIEAREITKQDHSKHWFQTMRCYRFAVQNPQLQFSQPAPAPVVPVNVPTPDPIPQDNTDNLPF